MTLGIIDTQHDRAPYCARCHYAERCILFIVMLSVFSIMLSDNMLNVVMMSVVAPFKILRAHTIIAFTAIISTVGQ